VIARCSQFQLERGRLIARLCLLPLEPVDLSRNPADRFLAARNLIAKVRFAAYAFKLLLAQQPDASLFCVAPLRTIGNRNTRLRYIVLN
jgi:hypothetical protein